MCKIAICENDSKTAGYIEQTLMSYAKSKLIKVIIEVYFSAEELYANISSGVRYDMLFLDIELREVSGIQLGYLIRNQIKDSSVIISFISSHTEMIQEIFDAEPQHFIQKPMTRKDIENVFWKMIYNYKNSKQEFFTYKFGKDFYRINKRDIIYFYFENRAVYLKTTAKGDYIEDYFYGTLSSVIDQMKGSNFFLVNRNYFVNLNYVSRLSKNEILLLTNESITLGSGKYYELERELRGTLRKEFI